MPTTHNVNCDAGEKIHDTILMASPGDTIMVTGVCTDCVVIPAEIVGITLDGQKKATIRPAGTDADGIFIFGRDIAVKGFTVVGGRDGIHLSGQAAGASAAINSNIIRQTARFGIHIDKGSYACVTNNLIENVAAAGIDITENSYARIGFRLPSSPDPAPNMIMGNGSHGIAVTRVSGAWIAFNEIARNKGSGVFVNRNSQADVVDNLINGNQGDGITVTQNSGVNLVSEGTAFPSRPNRSEATAANAGFAVRCLTAGYVEGPLGSLLGDKGSKKFDTSCCDRTVS
jgi:parallel beta helix pectate lyase-like protein